jgi:polyhydroxyalkanoate synthesis regulator phasin
MRQSNTSINKRLDKVLAEVRALKLVVIHGGLTYEQAKAKSEELLKIVNEAGEKIARKYGRRHNKIRFSDL